MRVKSNQEILQEIRDTIAARIPTLRDQVRGRLRIYQQSLPQDTPAHHAPIVWVLRAHLGTLDKIEPLFARDGEYSPFELIAITRNLFENLIWAKLFERDVQWGLILFEQLLVQQRQSLTALLAKIEAEAVLFDEFDKRDKANLHEHVIAPSKSGATPEDIRALFTAHHAASEELDEEVRRSFALYADNAKWNGYSYQAHLIRDQAIPHSQKDLAGVEDELATYRAVKSSILSEYMLARSNETRWNWKQRATDVGMGTQYDFLYSFTSRMLHSTPMNLITSKVLTGEEQRMMLAYCYTAIADLVEGIEAFDFPGRPNFFFVHFDGPEEPLSDA